jgi:hypothetical protein
VLVAQAPEVLDELELPLNPSSYKVSLFAIKWTYGSIKPMEALVWTQVKRNFLIRTAN